MNANESTAVRASISDIQKSVSTACGVDLDSLLDVRSRRKSVTAARHIAMCLARRNGFAFAQIARRFGCTRGAVVHGMKQGCAAIERAREIQWIVSEVGASI